MSSPVVSVIIPTFNWSAVLPYSVGSALQQTRDDLEVLVVGDGCTDDSEAVVAGLGDARARWINLPVNTGHQSHPNNEGLRQARGEFIAYLGHDDLWLPHHLACLLAALAAGADLACGFTMMIGADGRSAEPAPRRSTYRPGMWIPPTGVVHRRRVTDTVGGWKDYRTLTVDPEMDLWQRAHHGGFRFAVVPRLTAVKFPASWRRNVYTQRPHHEQAAWLDRIRREPDFEGVEAGRMLSAVMESRLLWRDGPYWKLLGELAAETRQRIRSRLQRRSVAAARAFKGVASRRAARQ